MKTLFLLLTWLGRMFTAVAPAILKMLQTPKKVYYAGKESAINNRISAYIRKQLRQTNPPDDSETPGSPNAD